MFSELFGGKAGEPTHSHLSAGVSVVMEPISLQSSFGPHSRSRRLFNSDSDPYEEAARRPFSRVELVRRSRQLPVPLTIPRDIRAKKSPYLMHMPQRKREMYLYSIGSLSIDSMDDKSLRLENVLKVQLSKIVSPSKTGSSTHSVDVNSSATVNSKKGLKNHPHPQQRQTGMNDFFLAPSEGEVSVMDQLWNGFPASTNRTVVATPISDLSELDNNISPGQTASTGGHSGMYGDFEDELLYHDVGDDEFIDVGGWNSS